ACGGLEAFLLGVYNLAPRFAIGSVYVSLLWRVYGGIVGMNIWPAMDLLGIATRCLSFVAS
ncbi:hypothetical protein BaRGS_00002158, partial [Batillaria attramentaria]